MPELNWYWGYVTTLGVMAIVAVGMVFFFWRRGWFKSFAAVRSKSKHLQNVGESRINGCNPDFVVGSGVNRGESQHSPQYFNIISA
jgi:hypothetical protein